MKLKDLLQKIAPIEPQDTLRADIILSMPLSQFKKAGLLVRVKCRHLNSEEIYIASSEKEAAVGRAEGLMVYFADEFIELCKGKPSPDIMRQIHEAKKILGGILIETRERGEA